MEKINLVESPVVFDSEHHTYQLEGHELSGVTPIISWLFPDTYRGIPQSVLDQAAEYGTLVHEKCELYDSMGIESEEVVSDYARIIRDAGLEVSCSEYLVSDGQSVASSIDKVFCDDSLGDIKTTSKVHRANVQVQLSIYAYLYELQTGRKANKLYLIWLPKPQYGKPCVEQLERIPAEVCQYVIEVFVANGDPLNAVAALSNYLMADTEKKRVRGEVPEQWEEVINELIIVKKQIDTLTEREKQIRQSLMVAMQEAGEDSWSSDLIQITRRAASERVTIDTKLLKEYEPSIFESYKKVTKVAESLTYKVL